MGKRGRRRGRLSAVTVAYGAECKKCRGQEFRLAWFTEPLLHGKPIPPGWVTICLACGDQSLIDLTGPGPVASS
jgi:hypothetical protein